MLIRSSGIRPRNCTAPSGLRVAVNCGGPSAPAWGVAGSSALSAKTSGSAFSNSPTTLSNVLCSVPCSATSVTSVSEIVTVPPPKELTASIAPATALPHVREGTPSACTQLLLPSKPAAEAATIITRSASWLSAAQASNRTPSVSLVNRAVNGEITGRGALIETASRTPSGVLRASAVSSRSLSAALSEIAFMATRSAPTEILDRGNISSARRL